MIRLKINLEPFNEVILLPLHYNSILQGFIYRNLSRSLADSLHDEGARFEKRHFKLFTFSKLFGRFHLRGKEIAFRGPVSFWVASPLVKVLESFASHVVKKEKIPLKGIIWRYCYQLLTENVRTDRKTCITPKTDSFPPKKEYESF